MEVKIKMQIDWLDFYGSGAGWILFLLVAFLLLLLAVPILYGMSKGELRAIKFPYRVGVISHALLKHGMSGTILILMGMLAAFFLGIGSFLYYDWTMTNPPILNDYALNSMTIAGIVTLLVCLFIFSTVLISRFAKSTFEAM